ncbi:MAG TPA: hypothetical protein VNO33_13675, partial [Kofleriaceae bacterium]|nr:hypothetical protein [Kofleriaceae bacterium]
MRHGWLVALAALLVPASAAAQSAADAGPADSPAPAGAGEAGEGDALPPMLSDPRQLSGVPRGEGTDPPGRLTVRAVQGAMKRTEFGDVQSTFPAGAKIHLFAVGAGGKVTLQTVPLDKTGRAVFDRLARGSQSYVALALFPREGAEDRLVSRLISMPPQVGIRMILAGEAVDSKKPPVDDLATEEPKVVPPGPGEVLVHVRGDTKDVAEVELFEAGTDKPLQRNKVEVTAGADGRKGLVARFTGVAGGGDKVFYARAADQPRPFISLPFQLTSAQGAATNLILAPPVLFAFHGGATLDDDRLYFQLDISLYNASLVPFQPGPEGLRIPLPHGYTSASVGEDDMGEGGPPVKVDEDRGLLWRGPVPA